LKVSIAKISHNFSTRGDFRCGERRASAVYFNASLTIRQWLG
jgi:hypothetical protein